uniref:Transposase n=1 Tax=Anaerobacillus isosaccharinicus TaxID=1532552 RepID=A0A1S2LIE4_9BACI
MTLTATASAVIYSIVETAKENQLNPLNYLTYLFEHLPQIDLDDQEALDQFLPWSKSIPNECRIPAKLK